MFRAKVVVQRRWLNRLLAYSLKHDTLVVDAYDLGLKAMRGILPVHVIMSRQKEIDGDGLRANDSFPLPIMNKCKSLIDSMNLNVALAVEEFW